MMEQLIRKMKEFSAAAIERESCVRLTNNQLCCIYLFSFYEKRYVFYVSWFSAETKGNKTPLLHFLHVRGFLLRLLGYLIINSVGKTKKISYLSVLFSLFRTYFLTPNIFFVLIFEENLSC